MRIASERDKGLQEMEALLVKSWHTNSLTDSLTEAPVQVFQLKKLQGYMRETKLNNFRAKAKGEEIRA